MYAFRCMNCGALEPAEAAGDNPLPGACHICGHGVRFDPLTGAKSYVPENWDVLAELSAGRRAEILKFHRLDESAIAKPRKPQVAEEVQS